MKERKMPTEEELRAMFLALTEEQLRSGRRELLHIDVTVTGQSIEEPEPGYTILTLPFTGFADGLWFRGDIQPGAADIQKRRNGEVERLCADYWLEGRDFTGAPCRVHVVNLDEGQGWKPIVETDSAALSFVNGADCYTVLELRLSGPIVHIYADLTPLHAYNTAALDAICAEDAVIRHVSKHRLPDGSVDIKGNLKIWNDALGRMHPIQLWPEGAPGFRPELEDDHPQPSIVFVPGKGVSEPRGTVIVAPGGGFETRTGCEGMNVAKYFVDAGFNAAILTYRIKPYSRWDAMYDMQRAIRLLHAHKDVLGITDKVVAMGFSAGGMLSANCATHFDAGKPEADDPVERCSCRPDAAVLGYGAFAFAGLPGGFFVDPFANVTFNPFVANKAELIYFAPEINITPETPPFFIWQTNSDDPRHSFTLGQALTAVGIPFEMHLFPEGVHGLALADGHNDLNMNLPHVARWASLCAEWLNAQNI